MAKATDFEKVKEEEEEEAKVSEVQRPFKRTKKSYIQLFLRQRNVNQKQEEEENNEEEEKIDSIASGFEERVRKLEQLVRIIEEERVLTCFLPK